MNGEPDTLRREPSFWIDSAETVLVDELVAYRNWLNVPGVCTVANAEGDAIDIVGDSGTSARKAGEAWIKLNDVA